jgi:hypothetical protein
LSAELLTVRCVDGSIMHGRPDNEDGKQCHGQLPPGGPHDGKSNKMMC